MVSLSVDYLGFCIKQHHDSKKAAEAAFSFHRQRIYAGGKSSGSGI
jgi:hypothetical protein